MGMTTTKKRHAMHTQPHEPLLVGWIVRGMTTTTTMTSNHSKTMERRLGGDEDEGNQTKKGPRDVINVSWATGIVFVLFSCFIFTLLTNVLGTSLNY
jgi:hypothetical protein